MLFPSQNSADTSSTSGQLLTAETKEKSLYKISTWCVAEAEEISDVNVSRYTLHETDKSLQPCLWVDILYVKQINLCNLNSFTAAV